MTDKITQKELLVEFFENNPYRDIKHPEVVDWVTKEYLNRTDHIFRDPPVFRKGIFSKS